MSKRTAQIVRLGAPADAHGEIFALGSIRPATVPVTVMFDPAVVIGSADLKEDGTAEITFAPSVPACFEPQTLSIGYRVIRSREENGVRILEEIEPITVGVVRRQP